MKTNNGYAVLLFSLTILSGCVETRDAWQQIILKSNAEKLYMYRSYSPYLQDSVLPLSFTFNPIDVVSEKNFEVYNSLSLGKKLRQYISETPQKAIYFFLFDRSVIDTVPWDSIRTKNLYLKRYTIRESDVDNTNDFILYYP